MGDRPWAADWEHVVGRDLVPHLISERQSQGVHLADGAAWLPEGALAALSCSVGRTWPADVLVIPAAAWRWDRWHRLSLFTPLSVAGIGEQGIGLWVQTVPAPAVRSQLPFSAIAVVEQRADGPWHVLAATGRETRLLVRYHEDAQAAVDTWAQRIRSRLVPVPTPAPSPQSGCGGVQWRGRDLDSLLRDDVVTASWTACAGRVLSLMAVTSREVIVAQALRTYRRPWRRTERTLFVPRGSIDHVAVVGPQSVVLRSAGADVCARLGSQKAALAASSWLARVLGVGVSLN